MTSITMLNIIKECTQKRNNALVYQRRFVTTTSLAMSSHGKLKHI